MTADTNIYISALNFGGMPGRLLRLAQAGAVQLVLSDAILAEIGEVLRRPKFAWPEERIGRMILQLSGFAERVVPQQTLDIVTADPDDNRILECADAGGVDYIVSGDRHLLRLRQHGNTSILKVADFLRLLQEPQE